MNIFKFIHFRIAKLFAFLALLTAYGGVAHAGTVTGAFNADNDYMVVVRDGNAPPRIVHNGPNDWGKTERFRFEIESTTLDQCSVNVIVWGDNAVREGLIGVLKGDTGVMYTGGPDWKAYQSNTMSNATVPVNLTTLLNSGPVTRPLPSPIADQWNIRGNYGFSDFGIAIPPGFSWVRPQGTNRTTNRYWVFEAPCGNLVKEDLPDVKGDHFQCYALGKGDKLKAENITVTDQFGRKNVVLARPRMLCNPSRKIHNRREFGVNDEKRHLVCYDYVRPPEFRQTPVRISNQFAVDDVVATRNQMFCVPSYKEHIKDTGTPGRPLPKEAIGEDVKRYKSGNIQRR